MRNSRQTPQLNAGSMADIAFLLLIFFLVTTTIPNDQGIVRKLPNKCEDPPCIEDFHQRNVLRIALNKNGELLVNNDLLHIRDLKDKLIEFIDNNGDNSCDYCHGHNFSDASDNPKKAVISLSSDRESSYKDFIAIQAELTAAYYELRATFVADTFGKETASLTPQELKTVREAYPLLISEANVK